ncbi:MAG TPA: YqgE/AlgH family protein [Rhizomicrobium sp.]
MALGNLQQPQADQGFLHGKLLIAMPSMPDTRFEKSVILMCSHTAGGAGGVIINKPIPALPFRDLMAKMDIPVTEATPRNPVLYGGPVDTDRGYVLHGTERAGRPSTLAITPEIGLTPTVDVLRAIADGRGPAQWLMALGYAGWGPGQIENEIAANGWIHCDADAGLVFDASMDAKWRLAFGKLGAGLSGLSSEAGRA